MPPPIPFVLEKEFGEHNAIMREAAHAGARDASVIDKSSGREAHA